MRTSIRARLLLVGAFIMVELEAGGQQLPNPAKQTASFLEIALVYNQQMSNIVAGNSFWMEGGSIQVDGQFWRGLSAVADVSGAHTASASNSGPGLDLITAAFGPRYTWTPAHRRYAFFGQALAGEANGLHSVFPNPAGASDSANSLAVQLGGGINVSLKSNLAIRVLDADWLRTQMPNATTNVQNNLRLGAGIVIRR